MKCLALLLICLSGLTAVASAQTPDSIEHRIILVGDAGDLVNGKAPVMESIRKHIPLDRKVSVIFLGDNLYRHGLPDELYPTYAQHQAVLDTQVNLVAGTPARGYFIPGNHDWENGNPGGLDAVIRQQRYIDAISPANIRFHPSNGCPGPIKVDVSENAVLIIMDSQWWIHKNEKPGIESDCPNKTEDEVLTQIKDILDHNPRKLVIFACHHPFKSTGVHSNFYGLKQHIFPLTDIPKLKYLYVPLPVIGSIYPISRSVFGTPQDLRHPTYANMIARVDEVLRSHPHVVRVAGHEHNLQLISDSSAHYIVSGSGCKTTRVAKSKTTDYVAQKLGYAVLDVQRNKDARIRFYEVEGDSTRVGYNDTLFNFSRLPPIAEDTVTVHEYVFKDSVRVEANKRYANTTWAQRIFLGDNYRQEWATPVRMRVFNINKEFGGFTIEGLGGGKQSKSLHLLDRNGRKWRLRTINKDPVKAVPYNLRHTFARDLVQDMISAAHPYAPLAVPTLARALEVTHMAPQYFFVPDDYALGFYRPAFANTICTLEPAEPEGPDTKSTQTVFNNMIEDNDHTVMQEPFLRARLLDMLIADYDRHYDQWKWSKVDTGKGKLYTPIPRDRDQTFFHSDGFIMWWATRTSLPFMKGFRYDMPRINWLGYVARDMDRLFLNELDEQDWKKTIAAFRRNLSDTVLSEAIHQLPPEIYPISGPTLLAKLKSRRNLLAEKKAMDYYRFISRSVTVLGSNKQEVFKISGTDSGMLVRVYARNKTGDTNFIRYERHFDPKITREIRLYGFNGDDYFEMDESARKGIKFRIVGGKGNDTFNIRGHARNLIYDLKTESNVITARNHTTNMMSDDINVHHYELKEEYNYNRLTIPTFKFGYNVEDGLLLGLGMHSRTHGFRKEPYATDQDLSALISPTNRAYQLKYRSEFIHLFREYDLAVNADFVNPTLNNFFGIGNETRYDKDKSLYYYRVRYKYASADVLARKRLFPVLAISLGPSIYHYWNRYDNNEDRILARPEELGLDSANVYSRKTYVGGKLLVDINNLNNRLFPSRGISWLTELSSMYGANENSKPFARFTTDMTVYASLTDPANQIAVLRLGYGKILSDQYEYFQALTLGQNNILRGYRKDRFAGSSRAYGSLELRVKLTDFKSYILPGQFGIIGFGEAGRVWARNDRSAKWHTDFGGGFYYVPFNMVIISATTAISPEDMLFNISVGTNFNITF